jgi:hypothetical protein
MRPISRNAESPGMQTGRPRAVVREDEIDARASPVNSRGASGIVIAFAWPGCGWTHSTLTYPPECRPNPRRQSRSGASSLPAVDDVGTAVVVVPNCPSGSQQRQAATIFFRNKVSWLSSVTSLSFPCWASVRSGRDPITVGPSCSRQGA